jgi:uncharacterized protein with HEPN domain
VNRDRERLLHIVEAIDRIEKYARRGWEAFRHDELLQAWVVHHVEIIGEAVRGLSDEFRSEHPEVPWREAMQMRNILVHQYFRVDLEEVWATVERDLPKLKQQIQVIV